MINSCGYWMQKGPTSVCRAAYMEDVGASGVKYAPLVAIEAVYRINSIALSKTASSKCTHYHDLTQSLIISRY